MTRETHADPFECRLERLDRALAEQKAYIARVPDPDNRARAEENLSTLVGMREAAGQDQPRTFG